MFRNPFASGPAAAVRDVRAAEARELVLKENALIVDVRGADEWASARIPGAQHVPLPELRARAGELPTDRPVIVQCASGARSHMAAQTLLALGLDNVVNLAGGIMDWAGSGFPIER